MRNWVIISQDWVMTSLLRQCLFLRIVSAWSLFDGLIGRGRRPAGCLLEDWDPRDDDQLNRRTVATDDGAAYVKPCVGILHRL